MSSGGVASAPRFVDKVAIVTGAGSGLGEATAVRLAGEGAHVAVLDIRAEAAEATVRRITDAGGHAQSGEVDVSDQASVRNAVADVVTALGRPEVLVNCAGVGQFDLSEEVALETWNRTIAVNLTGTFLMCQAALAGDPVRRGLRRLEGGRHSADAIAGVGIFGAGRACQCGRARGHRHAVVGELHLPSGR